MPHYNTTERKGQELARRRSKVAAQDEKVKACAIALHKMGKEMTPRRIWWMYQKMHGPILLTSLRRSVNTLIGSGVLKYVSGLTTRYKYITGKCPVTGLEGCNERQITL